MRYLLYIFAILVMIIYMFLNLYEYLFYPTATEAKILQICSVLTVPVPFLALTLEKKGDIIWFALPVFYAAPHMIAGIIGNDFGHFNVGWFLFVVVMTTGMCLFQRYYYRKIP